ILTDQLGLFDSDPSVNADAVLISQISSDDSRLESMAGGSRSGLGRGGMATKVSAAHLASRSGASTVIVSGDIDKVLTKVIAGEEIGTYLFANIAPIVARKQWLAGQLQAKGRLILDTGAVDVLKKSGKSLLAVGIKSVEGHFSRGELVICLDSEGIEVARGLVNYKSEEISLIKGKASQQFENILGYSDDEEVIHRDNLVLV
ncbi:MAG: glutamate 5-kinase, partial [Methyloprofundus sp.]|nr:glutamate 5-kinase [Methyloprofundus sp.]